MGDGGARPTPPGRLACPGGRDSEPGEPGNARKPGLSLHDLGVPSDGTGAVAAMVPNGFEFFEVAAAACRVEARFLPVNWHLKSDELAWILEDSGAQVLVAHTSLKDFVDGALAA